MLERYSSAQILPLTLFNTVRTIQLHLNLHLNKPYAMNRWSSRIQVTIRLLLCRLQLPQKEQNHAVFSDCCSSAGMHNLRPSIRFMQSCTC